MIEQQPADDLQETVVKNIMYRTRRAIVPGEGETVELAIRDAYAIGQSHAKSAVRKALGLDVDGY